MHKFTQYSLLIFIVLFSSACQSSKSLPKRDLNLIIIDLSANRIARTIGDYKTQESPCSTFKIALSLMGFDAGILRNGADPEWTCREEYNANLAIWRQPHTPSTWIKNSCVWYSQVLTSLLGMERFQDYVIKFGYGNQDISGNPGKGDGLSRSWLCSSLKISPLEQVEFIKKLLLKTLPVSASSYLQTQNLLYHSDLTDGWKLYVKTGCGSDEDSSRGWFVGWATNEEKNRTFIFASLVKSQDKDALANRDLAKASALDELKSIIESSKFSDITVKYKFAADAFYLMDQVSESMPKCFLVSDYIKYWIDKFGLSVQDKRLLQDYKTLRCRYTQIIDYPGFGIEPQTLAKAPNNLFSPSPNFIKDPIAYAFFSSDSLEDALRKIANIVSPEEHNFIDHFYKHFLLKIEQMTLLNSSKILQAQIDKQNDFLSSRDVIAHVENIRSFYKSSSYHGVALVVWRPSGGGFCASCYGPYIIIQLSPELLPMSQELFMIYTGVVVHEATHQLSSRMPDEQKYSLTEAFINRCEKLTNLATTQSYGLFTFIEEPLVQTLSQALFFKTYYPQYFDLKNGAYGHPLVKLYLPYVEEYFQANKSIDTNLVTLFADQYRNLI